MEPQLDDAPRRLDGRETSLGPDEAPQVPPEADAPFMKKATVYPLPEL